MAKSKIPIPIHENISDKHGKATPALVRYLNELEKKLSELEKRVEILETP